MPAFSYVSVEWTKMLIFEFVGVGHTPLRHIKRNKAIKRRHISAHPRTPRKILERPEHRARRAYESAQGKQVNFEKSLHRLGA